MLLQEDCSSKRVLVFVNTINALRRLSGTLKLVFEHRQVLVLHASMQQRQRLVYLERFKKDPFAVLVATDVAARGLDIEHVDVVVQHGLPKNPKTFVHRAGRSARAGSEGLCITLVGGADLHAFQNIQRAIASNMQERTVNLRNWASTQSQVRAATKEHAEISAEVDKAKDNKWFRKHAQDCDLELDDGLLKGALMITQKKKRMSRR